MQILRSAAAAIAISIISTLSGGLIAGAAEVRVLALSGVTPALTKVAPDFEKASGHKVVIVSGTPAVIRERLTKGEPFDAVFSAGPAWEDLLKDQKVGPPKPVAKFGLSVAVRSGAAKPALNNVDAFKKALADAQSIAIGDPRSGGPAIALQRAFERLGIAEQLALKLKSFPNGAAITQAVARGDAEIGIVVTPDLIVASGIETAGPLPPELPIAVMVVAGTTTGTSNADAARAFIEFVHRPASSEAFKASGLDLVP